jgi:hypothetical protein
VVVGSEPFLDVIHSSRRWPNSGRGEFRGTVAIGPPTATPS